MIFLILIYCVILSLIEMSHSDSEDMLAGVSSESEEEGDSACMNVIEHYHKFRRLE